MTRHQRKVRLLAEDAAALALTFVARKIGQAVTLASVERDRINRRQWIVHFQWEEGIGAGFDAPIVLVDADSGDCCLLPGF